MDLLLRRVNRRPSVSLLVVHSLLLSSTLVEGENYTSFNYPTFTSTDMLLFDRDAQFMSTTSSVWLNPFYNGSLDGKNYSFGALLYAESIQMLEKSSSASGDSSSDKPAVASFNTSFTLSITGRNSAGFAFVFIVNNHTTAAAGGQLCLVNKLHPDVNYQVLVVEFDTWQNPEYSDVSNNHVGVNINSMNSVAFYNLCGVGVSDRSYLVADEGSPDQDFTSWIDYDSTTQSLEVFLANGSTIRGVSKPANAIIQVPHLNVSTSLMDHMFVGFSGSGAMFKEVKQIKSWSFGTRQFHEEGMIAVSGNPSSELPGKQIAGVVAGALLGGLILFVGLGYKLFTVFGRPLRFFLSHAGGEAQEGKNFPDRLRDELTSSWKLKYFIRVFLDRRCLPKGNHFINDLKLELEKTEVGMVVVTKEFFTSKWPMAELVAFVESWKKNPGVRLLPLFYKMTPDELRGSVKEGIWEEEWTKMVASGNHPISVEDYRNAVTRLCQSHGVVYIARDRSYDKEYIESISKEVGKIVQEAMWKRVCCRIHCTKVEQSNVVNHPIPLPSRGSSQLHQFSTHFRRLCKSCTLPGKQLGAKVTTPEMDHSSKSTPSFEEKLNREDTQNDAHCKDKGQVELGATLRSEQL